MDEVWLSLVRVARDAGDISSLLPAGISNLADAPYTIHNAIMAGLQFLSFEELRESERPPKKIWLDGDKMTAWFEDVKRMREAEAKGHGDQSQMDRSPLAEELGYT